MSHDFDPTTGDFNSGRLPEPGAPPARLSRPAAPPTYRSSTSYPTYSAPAPRTSPSRDTDGGLGYGLMIAAVLAMLLFVGQPRTPQATPPTTNGATRGNPEATAPRDLTVEVQPPAPLPSAGLTRDGDRIAVTVGEVVLDAPWLIDRPTVISGRGSGASTIVFDGPGTLLTFAGEGTLRIEGVTLARRSTAAGNVLSAESGFIELVDVRLTGGVAGPGHSGSGLVLDANARATIDRSVVEGNAVGVRLLEAASAHLVNSEVRDNKAIGIVLAGRSDGVVRDSRIEGNGAEGIVVGDDGRASIAVSRIVANGARGMSFLGRATGSATGNQITGNGYGDAQRTDYWQGVAVQDAAHMTLHGNTVRDNAGVGIQFLHAAGGSVSDNTVTGNSANHAAYLLASGRPSVSAGGLVLGMLGQAHDPRPDVQRNRVERNTGGDIVDYRSTIHSDAAQLSPAPASVSPTPSQVYLLASSADGRGSLYASGHLNVYLADVPIHIDTRARNGPDIAPITVHAIRGDSLWIEVVNQNAEACRWSDVLLVHAGGQAHLVLPSTTIVSGCPRGVAALVEFVIP